MSDELERMLNAAAAIQHNDLIRAIAVSMASFIAAIESDSNAVADYIERRLMPLAGCARVDLRTLDALRSISRDGRAP